MLDAAWSSNQKNAPRTNAKTLVSCGRTVGTPLCSLLAATTPHKRQKNLTPAGHKYGTFSFTH